MTDIALATQDRVRASGISLLSSPGRVPPQTLTATSDGGDVDRHGIPLIIPRDQLYYWTGLWQDGVRLAREELDRSEYVEFDDPQEMMRWLFSTDE